MCCKATFVLCWEYTYISASSVFLARIHNEVGWSRRTCYVNLSGTLRGIPHAWTDDWNAEGKFRFSAARCEGKSASAFLVREFMNSIPLALPHLSWDLRSHHRCRQHQQLSSRTVCPWNVRSFPLQGSPWFCSDLSSKRLTARLILSSIFKKQIKWISNTLSRQN